MRRTMVINLDIFNLEPTLHRITSAKDPWLECYLII